jgi:nitrate reductase NapAB chaperone NapD
MSAPVAAPGPEVHIAGLVVHASPQAAARIADAIRGRDGAVVHAHSPDGRLVVTLEADGGDAIAAAVVDIQRIDGVLAASLVYQHSEPAPRCKTRSTVKITRREFVRQSAAAAAATVAGVPLPGGAQNIVTDASITRMTWSKAPCRFCGTGCGVNVAVKDGRVVATHGDINSEVNRGLNCVKGYFLSKIMYGRTGSPRRCCA